MRCPHCDGLITPRRMDHRDENGLTPRERQIIGLLVEGKKQQQIADELKVSVRTVANHLDSAYRATGTHNRIELAVLAIKRGIVDVGEDAVA